VGGWLPLLIYFRTITSTVMDYDGNTKGSDNVMEVVVMWCRWWWWW
jgi:hypothetical protein